MKKLARNNKILFITPPFLRWTKGTYAGISYLRGFLKSKSIESSILNFSDILSDIDMIVEDKENRNLVLNFKKHLIKKINLKNKNILLSPYSDILILNQLYLDFCKDDIWDTIDNTNFFDQLFIKYFQDYAGIKFIGISITYYSQFLFSLMLVNFIKNKLKNNIKIILGGHLITMYIDELIPFLNKNKIIDYLIAGEGETPLYQVIKNQKLSKIPNLFYLDNDHYKNPNLYYSEDIKHLACPIFLPGDKPVIQASRKCYWGKCTFCCYDRYYSKKALIRSVDDVINDVKQIHSTLNNNKLVYRFADSALPIPFLENFSKRIIRYKNFPKNFKTFLRLEPQLNYKILKTAKEAGFGTAKNASIMFGIETSAPRLLKLMNKGIELTNLFKILDICLKIDQKVTLDFMIGLPTQTEKELLTDLDFMTSMVEKYNVYLYIFLFYVHPNSYIYKNPSEFNIKIFPNRKKFLSNFVPFKQLNNNAVSSERTQYIFNRYYSKLSPFYQNHILVKFNL